jgi:RimJ/RimL family protein N-acetyltransferase
MDRVGIPTLETERLVLRGWRESDLEPYHALTSDPDVMRHLGGGEVMDREGTWRNIALILGHWVLRGFGFWAVEEKATGDFVGRVGLWQPEGWPGLEVGWALVRRHWGRGIATEAGRASLGYAFGTLGMRRVISLILPENNRSIRVAERLGERHVRNIVKFNRDCLIYGIERSSFSSLA